MTTLNGAFSLYDVELAMSIPVQEVRIIVDAVNDSTKVSGELMDEFFFQKIGVHICLRFPRSVRKVWDVTPSRVEQQAILELLDRFLSHHKSDRELLTIGLGNEIGGMGRVDKSDYNDYFKWLKTLAEIIKDEGIKVCGPALAAPHIINREHTANLRFLFDSVVNFWEEYCDVGDVHLNIREADEGMKVLESIYNEVDPNIEITIGEASFAHASKDELNNSEWMIKNMNSLYRFCNTQGVRTIHWLAYPIDRDGGWRYASLFDSHQQPNEPIFSIVQRILQ